MLKGSKTEKNLIKTFAGESRARNKYDLFAEKADCEGEYWISNVFRETALNEYAHAREAFVRYLDMVGTTESNLLNALIGESEEAEVIYKEFERDARKEGFDEIADFFKELQEVEGNHGKRFKELLDDLRKGDLYKREKSTLWKCSNCGYIHDGKKAPDKCPLCKFPKGYFEEYCKCKNN